MYLWLLQHGKICEYTDCVRGKYRPALSDGEAEKALVESRKLQADWEKIHDKLCVFLPHEHLEPLENIFAVLPYYIEQEEVSLARAECQMVKNTAEHIQKTERIAFENVF